MTAPATDIPTRFPWLRTDPATIGGSPPNTVLALVSGANARWTQLYLEWLRGTTEGVPNWELVGATSGEQAAADFRELQKPTGSNTERKDKRAALAKKFQSYGAFVLDVKNITAAVAERADQLQDKAKAGKQKLHRKDAVRLAGRETATAVTKKQLAEGRRELADINIAMVARIQLKQFQVTALEQFNAALNGLGTARWDTPDPKDETKSVGPSPEKTDAMKALEEAGARMFAAYGVVESAAAEVLRTPQGQAVPDAAADALAEAVTDFGLVIAELSKAMGTAARLFGTWARRVTKEFIRANFTEIYPYAGVGLYALRMLCGAASIATSFLPGYTMIGDAIGVADDFLETAIIELTAFQASADPETQKKFAHQSFEVTDEHKNDVLVRVQQGRDAAVKMKDDLVDKVKDATGITKLEQKVGEGLHAAATEVGMSETAINDVQAAAGFVGEKTKTVLGAAGLPTDAAGLAKKGLEFGTKRVLNNVPVLATVFAAGAMLSDTASVYAAVHSQLQTNEGVSEAQLEHTRELMDKPPANEGFQLFTFGSVRVREVRYPEVVVDASGVELTVHLETHLVRISDLGKISQKILGFARSWATKDPNDDNGLRFQGRRYVPDWGGWQLQVTDTARSPFRASVPAVHTTPAEDFTVTLGLEIDLDYTECRVVSTTLTLRPEGLDGKLSHNENLAEGQQPEPITAKDLEDNFGGQKVSFDGVEYTLGEASLIKPDADWAWVEFHMSATDPGGARTSLRLSYATYQPLRVEEVVGAVKLVSAEELTELVELAEKRALVKKVTENPDKKPKTLAGRFWAAFS